MSGLEDTVELVQARVRDDTGAAEHNPNEADSALRAAEHNPNEADSEEVPVSTCT
jgi:hypothetical protein